VIYGQRIRRDDGWRRVAASIVLKLTLLFFVRTYCVDANVPYRLMKTGRLAGKMEEIPDSFCLSNVGLAVVLANDKRWKHGAVPIRFRERYGGEPSVKLGKFGEKAFELVRQLKGLTDHSGPE
jgi:hypothetical protein